MQKFKALPGKAIIYTLLILWASISLFGISWVILTSLKTNQELYSIRSIWGFPAIPQWINYANAWVRSRMDQFFTNSIVVSAATVSLINLIASMAAYILGRFKFKSAKPLLVFFMIGMAIPVQMIVVPLFLLFLDLKLADTLIGLILVYTAVSLPFSIFVLTGFLEPFQKN
jgi:ABC-type glycerol-3-phosphate transport system permease component